MPQTRDYTYSDFWAVRASRTNWLTTHVGYRIGALFALWAARIGLTPNALSLLSLLVSTAGALGVFWFESPLTGGLWLLVWLQAGYALDCADGPLARVTGQTSTFGGVLDKLSDCASGLLMIGLLCIAATSSPSPRLPDFIYPYLMLWALVPRTVLNLTVWLKGIILYQVDRSRRDDRSRTMGWFLRKLLGQFLDEPFYRLCIAFAWVFGLFWEFVVAYNAVLLLVLCLIVRGTQQEMAAADARAANDANTDHDRPEHDIAETDTEQLRPTTEGATTD